MNKEKYLDVVLNFLCDESGIDNNASSFDEKVSLWRKLVNERDVIDIPDDVLDAEDKFLRFQLLNKKLTNGEELKPVNELMDIDIKHGDKICLWKGDITSIYCDAIVNSGNSSMLGCFIPECKCIDNCIHSFSGIRLRKKCNVIMNNSELKVSDVLITRAYNLPCDFIIHTVGPEINGVLTNDDKEALKNTYINILDCAKNNLVKTLVFCCISTGENKFPKNEACKIAVDTVNEYLDVNDKFFSNIIFDVFTDEDFDIYEEYLTK